MNRISSVFFLVVFFFFICGAQEDATYFQQQVDFKINVTLNDVDHSLTGEIEITYTNNSPETLDRIWLHLWPNAYSSKTTAFAEQQLDLGNMKFYHASVKQMGSIDQLDFHSRGEKLSLTIDQENPDIARLKLSDPLAPGENVVLKSPFFVKIPSSFSRLGHVGQTYQITQWFPKPAVYDRNGWQTMPYLDQGEYYSEFGKFDVSITVPSNYIVAATGQLSTKSEIKFLENRIEETRLLSTTDDISLDTIPPSSKQLKTIRFSAENVHDFAWFADKRFRVDKSTIKLKSGREVDTWAFYTKSESTLWKKATEYINRSVEFYSDHVGEYPYPQATAVQSPLSAGGGMEYPMITLIGLAGSDYLLDQVITHEVGHNWFYGILGSNERAYPWMDEGLNTFIEYKYTDKYYEKEGNKFIPNFLTGKSDMRDEQVLYSEMAARQKIDKPGSDSRYQNGISYYLNAYEYPAKVLQMVESMIGRENLATALTNYFVNWKFKHPDPLDFQSEIESVCDCQLNWLTRDLLFDGALIDYGIQKVENDKTVTIINRTGSMIPFEIIGLKSGRETFRIWKDGFKGTESFQLPKSIDELQLYDPHYSLDVQWADNHWKKGAFPAKPGPLLFNFFGGIQSSDRNQIGYFPIAGWNDADKGMLGLGLHNGFLPSKKVQWVVAPMYSFSAKTIVGMGELRWNAYPSSGPLSRISAKMSFKSFHYNFDNNYEFYDRYDKIEPAIWTELRKDSSSDPITHSFAFRYARIHQDYGVGLNFAERIFGRDQRSYYVTELKYRRTSSFVVSPSKLELILQQGKGFARSTLNFRQKFSYAKKGKGLFVRIFGGAMLRNIQPDANTNFVFNGIFSDGFFSKDYMYDEILFGRNTQSGILSQQVFLRDAELKTLSNIGLSNSWMTGAGLSTSLPIPIPLHFYIDVAIYNSPISGKVAFNYSSGLAIVLAKDFLEIYFPLFESRDIRESLTYNIREKYLQRISFLVDLKALHPFDMTDKYFEFLY